MSTTDPEEEMRLLIDGLNLEAPVVVAVTGLTDLELVTRWGRVHQDLRELNELTAPRTSTGRELHSLRDAYMVEMTRRGMR